MLPLASIHFSIEKALGLSALGLIVILFLLLLFIYLVKKSYGQGEEE